MTAVGERLELPAPQQPARTSPYQGLVPYSEEDWDYFFGRNTWRDIITDHLLAYRVSVLYGASGVGKSSVLRAGVIHNLREAAQRNCEVFGLPESTPVLVSGWSGDARQAVVDAIEASVAAVLPQLAEDPPSGALAELFQAWADRLGGPLLLVLDQFDEYFVYHELEAATSPFAVELVDALTLPDVPGNVLFSIREDALAKLDTFQDSIPDLWQNLLRLEQLDQDAAREAIELPLRRWEQREKETVQLEPGLVDAVLAEASTGTVRLGRVGRGFVESEGEAEEPSRLVEAPYLQLVMTRLWEEERRRGSSMLRVSTLTRLGGGDQIVRRHFDSVMRSLPRRRRKVAARIFQYLVTPAGTKIALPATALAKWSGQKERKVEPVLRTLADSKNRILRTVSTAGNQGTSYEIYHDRLAEGILDWRRRFVRRRRIRRVVVLFGLLIAIAALGIMGAVDERSDRLGLQANVDEVAPGLLRLLDMQSKAEEAARRSPHFTAVVARHSDAVHTVAFSADGEHVATASSDGTARVAAIAGGTARVIRPVAPVAAAQFVRGGFVGIETWAGRASIWKDGRTLRGIPAEGLYVSLGFTGDGKRVITVAAAGAKVRSVPAGDVLTSVGKSAGLDSAAISRDGRIVVTTGARSDVWDGRTGDRIRRLPTRASPVATAIAPGGRAVVTVSPKQALLWPLPTGAPVPLKGAPTSIAPPDIHPNLDRLVHFAPDGRLAVAGTRTPTISDADGRLLLELGGHSKPATVVRFSHDGRRIATGSYDGSVRIWHARTGRVVAVLRGHQGAVTSVAFHPRNSERVVTAAYDGTAIIWNVARNSSGAVD